MTYLNTNGKSGVKSIKEKINCCDESYVLIKTRPHTLTSNQNLICTLLMYFYDFEYSCKLLFRY